MSQFFYIGPSFDLMTKNGKILMIFSLLFSRFHKIKTRAYLKNLRHASLHINVFYEYVKLYVWEISIRGDILVQKIKVKKYIFQFLTL